MPAMLRIFPLPLIAISAVALGQASATSPTVAPPNRSYTPVAITLPAPSPDDSLDRFRAQVLAAARNRVYAELARLVRPQGFFWGRDYDRRFDPRRPAVDNLAAALALERDNGSGWDLLAAFAAEKAVDPLPSRPGVVCAPAQPAYDVAALARLLDDTYTEQMDWAYPRGDRTAVHLLPEKGAPVVGTLGLHFVRVLGYEGSDGKAAPDRTLWAQVVMPDGRSGFVPPGTLRSLATERLCYAKDAVIGWQIGGFIAGGH